MTNRFMLRDLFRFGFSRKNGNKVGIIAAVSCLVFTIGSAWAGNIVTNHDDNNHGRFCSKTAFVSGKGIKQTSVKTPALEKAKLLIEHNATDEDTGFQGFADGEPWNEPCLSG
jgi:hypothetical protein